MFGLMQKKARSLKTNALLNMIRRGSSILFPIATFSYASHKLGASGMGAFSFCNSIIGYFLLFAALGISTYAVREGQAVRDDKAELDKFASEVYTINVITTILAYIILVILMVTWHKLDGYRELLFLLSIIILMTTIGADWINMLFEDYLYITIRYIGVQLASFILMIVLVKEPRDIYKYTLIVALSFAGGNLLNAWYVRRKVSLHITKQINFRKHIVPMLTLFSNSLAINIYLIADITILGMLMEDKYVGYYSVASKSYTAIKEMINAIVIVTVPRFSYYISHKQFDKYAKSFSDVCNGVVTLMFPCIVGLIFQSENIVYYLGGAEYTEGARALQILSTAMIFAVGACLLSQSVLIPNKMERHYLIATIIAAVTNIVLNFALIPKFGIEAASITTLISEFVVFIIMLLKGKDAMQDINYKKSDVTSALIGTVSVVIICMAVKRTINDRLTDMLTSIALSIVIYTAIICLMKNNTAKKLIGSFISKNNE